MRLALALAVTLVPTIAAARPITAGVNLGVDQSKEDGLSGADPNHTLGLFGRLGFTPRLSGQIEASQIKSSDEYGNVSEVRSGTALLVVDLSSSKTFVPILLVGAGIDKARNDYQDESATHIEGGFGFEYRASNGFTLGADVRMGGRSVDQGDELQPLTGGREDYALVYYPPAIHEGEYRSARITLGIRF